MTTHVRAGGMGTGCLYSHKPKGVPLPFGFYILAGEAVTGGAMTVQDGDLLKVTAILDVVSVLTIENVFGFEIINAGNGDDQDVMTDLAQKVDDVYAELQTIMNVNVGFSEVHGFNLTQNVPMPIVPFPTLTVGALSTSFYAEGCAALLLIRTNALRVLGRKFFGGFTEGAFEDGLLTTGTITAVTAAGLTMIVETPGPASGAIYRYVVIDKSGLPHVAVSLDVGNIIAYQRRRKRGRGI